MTGKIARLPRDLREQLNRRLRNHEPGKTLVQWLNALPEVQKILAAEFDGLPVRPQNLSEWRRHGYREWLAGQEVRESLGELAAEGEELKAGLGGPVADKLTGWLVAHFMAEARAKLAAAKTPDERWSVYQVLAAHLVPLRRGDYNADRLRLEQDRLEVTRRLTREQKDREFEQWFQRPEVKEKFRPKEPGDRSIRRVKNILDHFLLGAPLEDLNGRDDEHPEPPPDPACLI